MKYELKKTQLTLAETLRIVADAVDACFDTDENDNDIDFRPEMKNISLQCAFCEHYLELELSEDFDEAFATYMAVDIDEYIHNNPTREEDKFNIDQWYSICNAVSDKIDFRKQKMLQKNIKVTSILDEEIIKLSDVLAKTVAELPKTFDYSSIQPFVDKINSMSNIDEKKIVQAVVNNNHSLKNKFLGHLKKQKKTKKDNSVTKVDKIESGEE